MFYFFVVAETLESMDYENVVSRTFSPPTNFCFHSLATTFVFLGTGSVGEPRIRVFVFSLPVHETRFFFYEEENPGSV